MTLRLGVSNIHIMFYIYNVQATQEADAIKNTHLWCEPSKNERKGLFGISAL